MDAALKVGRIQGPGEFEIGDVSIRALGVGTGKVPGARSASSEDALLTSLRSRVPRGERRTSSTPRSGAPSSSHSIAPGTFDTSFSPNGAKVIYDVEIGGVHVGIIGGCEEGLDELGMIGVLCTSSVRAVREIEPKVVIAMGNVDGMVTDLKLSARTEKKYKVKNNDSLPVALEVVVLN